MAAATGNITRRKIQRQASLERSAFMFMRMSGIVLLILAVGHMMIQHVLNSSAHLTLQFVADQWDTWGWKVYDMLLLIFAYFHGINGLRNVLEDYIHNRSLMKNITTVLAIFAVVTVIWAGFAIVSFNPEVVR